MLATNVVASKYFRGTPGTPERETSVRKLVARVVDTLTRWGQEGGYFATETDRRGLPRRAHPPAAPPEGGLQLARSGSTWAWRPHPQCSACFINSVDDSMESILGLAQDRRACSSSTASGTGTNLSPIRSSKELLAGGGTASGPVSFMKGFDAFAGRHQERRQDPPRGEDGHPQRRAPGHPRVHPLQGRTRRRRPGRSSTPATTRRFNGEAYGSVFFQNSNNSVRVTDDFMKAVVEDRPWSTRAVRDGRCHGHLPGARPVPGDRRGGAPVRRPGPAVRHHGQRRGTPARTRRASTRPTPAPSTCSSTTRPATWRR